MAGVFYRKQRNTMKPISSQPKRLAGLIILIVATLLISSCDLPSNQPPIISSLTTNEEWVESADICQVECTASDPDEDELSYTWSTDGGNISGEGSTVSWTAPEALGTYTITVEVTDGRGGEDTTQLTVNVVAPNHLPIIENLVVTAEHRYLEEITVGFTDLRSGYKVLEGKAYEIKCGASDPDGDELLFEWSTDGGGVSGEGAVVTWTAPPRGGEVSVIVTVSDGRGGVATESIVFAVVTCGSCAF
ncbi:hypothetical protein ES703_14287 [subsurface metagenome]